MSTDHPLPRGWAWALVEDVGEVQLGRQRSPEHHRGEHMRPYLRVANVFEDRIDTTDVMEMNFTPEEFETFRLKYGDILLNEGQTRELVGRPAMYRDELPGACYTNSLVRFTARKCAIPEYALALFRYYLHSGRFTKLAKITTNIAHLGAGRFAKVEFPLAPLNEQRRIVAKIEDITARSRRAREALERIPPLLERFRQSVLAAAFRGDLTAEWRRTNPDVEPATVLLHRIRVERRRRWEEAELRAMRAKGQLPASGKWREKYQQPEPVDAGVLPELPKGWCWAAVEELARVGTGSTPLRSDPAFWDGGTIPWIKSGALNARTVAKADEFVTEAALEDPKGRLDLYEPGTLLIAMYGEGRTRGLCAELRVRAATNQAIAAVVTEGEEPTACRPYLRLFFEKNYEDVRRLSSGGVQPNLNCGIVKRIAVPLAPLAEQKVLVKSLEHQLAVQAKLKEQAASFLPQLARLEQGILAKAFRGELVPQDPSDEPASVLLERIRAERAKYEPKTAKSTRGRKSKTEVEQESAEA